MRTHLGSDALDDLERAGLKIHTEHGHLSIGTHRLMRLRIDVSVHEPHGRTIALSSDGLTSMRQLPLDELQAKGLVNEFAAARPYGLSDHVRRTLEHLVLHAGHTAEQLELRTMTLDPVTVAEGGY